MNRIGNYTRSMPSLLKVVDHTYIYIYIVQYSTKDSDTINRFKERLSLGNSDVSFVQYQYHNSSTSNTSSSYTPAEEEYAGRGVLNIP